MERKQSKPLGEKWRSSSKIQKYKKYSLDELAAEFNLTESQARRRIKQFNKNVYCRRYLFNDLFLKYERINWTKLKNLIFNNRPNKIDDNYSMYALRIATKDLADIKQLSKKLSDDTDTQISIADIMRYCIINYKQNAEKYFKETAYDRES